MPEARRQPDSICRGCTDGLVIRARRRQRTGWEPLGASRRRRGTRHSGDDRVAAFVARGWRGKPLLSWCVAGTGPEKHNGRHGTFPVVMCVILPFWVAAVHSPAGAYRGPPYREEVTLAYGIVHHFPGGTKEQYEASIAAVHPSRDRLPDGQIFTRPARRPAAGRSSRSTSPRRAGRASATAS